MTIDEYFESCPYIASFKKAGDYNVLETKTKPSWKIPNNGSVKHNPQGKDKEGYLVSWFYGEISFDEIYSWFISDVVKMNIENEQKEKLLKEKVEELKTIFKSSSLDDLKSLSFETGLDLDITTEEDIKEEENGPTE